MAGEPISTNPKSLSHLRVVIDRLRRLAESTSTAVTELAGGVTSTQTTSGTVNIGAPVYAVSAGVVAEADATTIATAKVIGFATETILTGLPIIIKHAAEIENGAWSLTAGADYYLDTTAGDITLTRPTVVGQVVVSLGTATAATKLAIVLAPPILL